MGATSEYIIINTTLEIHKDDSTSFERYLSETFRCVDYRHIQDTKELYEKDDYFKKLVKAEKKARDLKLDYINKNN